MALLFLLLAASFSLLFRDQLGQTPTALIFLTAVLGAAIRSGLRIGIVTAVAAFFLLNFLFAEPHFSLMVQHPQDLITLAVFLLVAGLTGVMAGRLREQRDAAKGRAAVLSVLSEVSNDLLAAENPDQAMMAALPHLGNVTQGPVMVLGRKDDYGVELVHALPKDFTPNASDLLSADSALRHGRIEFAAAHGWNGSRFTFLPITEGAHPKLVLGHVRLPEKLTDLAYREEAVAVIRQQVQLAMERLRERGRAHAEAQRATLLASLSHDLRTPLATILGSVSTLREFGAALPPAAQHDLLEAAEQEARRLSQYVTNLLQMTRLKAGIALHLAWVDVGDVAQAAAARVTAAHPLAEITLNLPEDLPMIRAEAELLEQSLTNLLDNAVKYAPGKIQLSASAGPRNLIVQVQDQGPGLPQGLSEWLDGPSLTMLAGTHGLGLTICKGIAQILGGRLSASLPATGGTIMELLLPLPPTAVLPQSDADIRGIDPLAAGSQQGASI